MCSDIVPGNSVTPGNKQAEPESTTNGEERRGGKARSSENTLTHTPLLSESEISSSGSERNQQWSVFKAKGGGRRCCYSCPFMKSNQRDRRNQATEAA